MAERCATCIFRPGNLMDLNKGRVAGMLDDCVASEGHVPCHEVMDTPEPAICRGFYDSNVADRSLAIRYGRMVDKLIFVDR